MSRASVLQRGRAMAEAGMVDSCVITRVTGSTTDPDSGIRTPTTSTVYTGKCRLQQPGDGTSAKAVTVGEAYRLLSPRELQLPVSTSGDVLAGDKVTMTACVNDAALVGKVFTIRDEPGKSEATSRRFGIEAVTS